VIISSSSWFQLSVVHTVKECLKALFFAPMSVCVVLVIGERREWYRHGRVTQC